MARLGCALMPRGCAWLRAVAAVGSLTAASVFAAEPPQSTLDYVQDGLVAQWDAIENAGRGVHSDTIAAWKDLISTNDVTIPAWVTVEKEALYSQGAISGHTAPDEFTLDGEVGNMIYYR